MATTLHLVRHAAHDLVGQVLAGRSVDAVLNVTGKRAADALALRLAKEPVTRVLSSPRRRARQTAAPIAAMFGLRLEIAEALDEHDAGQWSGARFEALAADPLWRRWNERRDLVRPPDGESMAELQIRIVNCLHELGRVHTGETLVLVSHAEPIRAALMRAHGIPLEDFHKVDVPVGSISTLIVDAWTALQPAPAAYVPQQGAA